MNLLCGERSEPKVDFSQSKHYRGGPEYAEEAWCKVSARSVKSFHSYGQKTALSVSPYIYICVCIQLWPDEDKGWSLENLEIEVT